jgi:hypothetical protein
MTIATVRGVLLWCTLINFGFLALWGLSMLLVRGGMHRLVGRWYRISPEQFDTVTYAGILIYKILIIAFNLVPYIALVIVGRG